MGTRLGGGGKEPQNQIFFLEGGIADVRVKKPHCASRALSLGSFVPGTGHLCPVGREGGREERMAREGSALNPH